MSTITLICFRKLMRQYRKNVKNKWQDVRRRRWCEVGLAGRTQSQMFCFLLKNYLLPCLSYYILEFSFAGTLLNWGVHITICYQTLPADWCSRGESRDVSYISTFVLYGITWVEWCIFYYDINKFSILYWVSLCTKILLLCNVIFSFWWRLLVGFCKSHEREILKLLLCIWGHITMN